MNELPLCHQRFAVREKEQLCACKSNRLVGNKLHVPFAFCATCVYADKPNVKTEEQQAKVAAVQQRFLGPVPPCKHRGEPTGVKKECTLCGMRGQMIELVTCRLLTHCSPEKPLRYVEGETAVNVKCCRDCDRREE